jgi:Cysteine-rich CPXCG
MVLDLSIRRQTYIEDCEVCCQPIQISYDVETGSLTHFEAQTME